MTFTPPSKNPNKESEDHEQPRGPLSSHKTPSMPSRLHSLDGTLSADQSTPAKLRAVIVARVSSAKQGTEDKVSLTTQVRNRRAFAERLGLTVVEEISIVVSGRNPAAPHLARLRRLVSQRTIEVILFEQVDRGFRELRLGMQCVEEWWDAGVKCYFGERTFDLNDPTEKLLLQLMLGFAEHEAGRVRGRGQLGKLERAASGFYYRKKPPFGFALRERRLVPNDQAASIPRLFQEVAEAGWRFCFTHGTARGLSLDKDEFLEILRNPVYRGVNRFGKTEFPYEPHRLVTDELWHKVQDMLKPEARAAIREHFRVSVAEYGPLPVVLGILEKSRMQCRQCMAQGVDSELHFAGAHATRYGAIPYLECSKGHAVPMIPKRVIDDVLPPLRTCWECGEVRKTRFAVERRGPVFAVRCRQCDWTTTTPRFPFGHLQPELRPGHRQPRLDAFGAEESPP